MSLIILKIDHMLLLWFSIASEGKRAKLEDSIAIVRRRLEFMGSHSLLAVTSAFSDEVSTQDVVSIFKRVCYVTWFTQWFFLVVVVY